MSITAQDASRKFSSFAGTDIRVVINGKPLGNMQAISYAIQREKAPIYVMGSKEPKSFSRGKRGIAGTLVAMLFDRHLLFESSFAEEVFVANNDETWATVGTPNTINDAGGTGIADLNDPAALENTDVGDDIAGTMYSVRNAWYVDQLPPFDAVIIAQSEYGVSAQMRIYGIELLNEGSGFSIDDMNISSQHTYIAKSIWPWQKVGAFDMTKGSGNTFTASGPTPR